MSLKHWLFLGLVLFLGVDAIASEQGVEPSEAPAESVDPASNPPAPVVVSDAPKLKTRLTARSHSEMFFTQRPQLKRLSDGRYAMAGSSNVFPFYETVNLRVDELGHQGLSIHFQGWAGLDLAALYFDERIVADLNYLYVQFQHRGMDAKLGRQMVFAGAMRGLHIDGLSFEYESPIHLGVQAVVGLMVRPRLGPEWYRLEYGDPIDVTYEDYGAGFSDWTRGWGDNALGGRVFYRWAGRLSAGASVMQTRHLEEVEYQLFGFDADVRLLDFLAVSGDGTVDLVFQDFREANVAVDIVPWERLSFSLEGRHADPSLYVSHLSIFSVFSDEEYDSIGGTITGRPTDWLTLIGQYHQNFYGFIAWNDDLAEYEVERELGYEVIVGGRVTPLPGLRALLDYRRFSESGRGVHQLRGGLIAPLPLDGLRIHTNLYFDRYDQGAALGETERRNGFMGDLGLHYRKGVIEAGGSLLVGFTPYAEHEISGMLKFAYNFDVRFYEQLQ